MSGYIQANTNGSLHPADQPSIAPLNRGFLYGDAIYEVWRTYHGAIFAWEEHWRRLERSANALFLVLPFTSEQIFREIKRTTAEFRRRSPESGSDLYIRLQVTRGGGPIGLDTGLADKADYVLLVQENKAYAPDRIQTGLTLSLARELRRNPPQSLNPAWKTGNYLNNILCLREARSRGADEVVITNLAGEVTEAAVSNIAFVRAGRVITPPMDSGILAGITRQLLFDAVGPGAQVPVEEARVGVEDLGGMEECFLLSTTKDITPVRAIDQWTFSTSPDSVALGLKRQFALYTAEYARRHPELAL